MAGLICELDFVVESMIADPLQELADFMLPLRDEGEVLFVFREENLYLFVGGGEAVF